jgi:hypothetical protein
MLQRAKSAAKAQRIFIFDILRFDFASSLRILTQAYIFRRLTPPAIHPSPMKQRYGCAGWSARQYRRNKPRAQKSRTPAEMSPAYDNHIAPLRL